MKCEKCNKPVIALVEKKTSNNKQPRQERCECASSNPSTTGENSPIVPTTQEDTIADTNTTNQAMNGSKASAKKKSSGAPILLSTVNCDFWVGVQVRIQKAALGAKEEDVGICTVQRSGNGWVQLQSKNGMVAKRAYNLELVGPPPTGPMVVSPPINSTATATIATSVESKVNTATTHTATANSADAAAPIRRSVCPSGAAVVDNSVAGAVIEIDNLTENSRGDDVTKKNASKTVKRKLPDDTDNLADTSNQGDSKEHADGFDESFDHQALSQQSVEPLSQSQTAQGQTGSQRTSQRREKPVHDQYSDFYMGSDKELTRRTAAVSSTRRPATQSDRSTARPSSGTQATSSSHNSGGSKNVKKTSTTGHSGAASGDPNAAAGGDQPSGPAAGALGGFSSNGPKINALLCEVKRSYVQKFVERYSEKIKGRPDLGYWLTKVKSRAIDTTFEKEVAMKFPTGLCTYCNVEKWPGSDTCWNEWCVCSPIYWELPGARGDHPPTKPIGMLVCSDDIVFPNQQLTINSSSSQQQLNTGPTSLLTSSDNSILKSSSLLQIDTSGAFANTSMDAPSSSRNSGPGSGNSSIQNRDLSLLSPLARIGSIDDMEPTPRRKARRMQENARLGGKSPAAGSMSPGPLTKKRSFSLDGSMSYIPAVTSESLRYLTADELGYSACPYHLQDVSQYLLRVPTQLLPTKDPSVRPQEVYTDTDVDGSFTESKMD